MHPQVVQMIWDRYRKAHVDLFTSEGTTHRPLWFSLTEATLHSMRLSDDRVILVAPKWPARIWFSTLLRLLDGDPWQLPVRRDLLSQLDGKVCHLSPSLLQLWVWLDRSLLTDLEPSICETLWSARAPSTRLVYGNCWVAFSSWCRDKGLD